VLHIERWLKAPFCKCGWEVGSTHQGCAARLGDRPRAELHRSVLMRSPERLGILSAPA
jgi:hypothetical protein